MSVVQEDGDERNAQPLRDFDALFEELEFAIDKYNLDKPPLFENEVDHSCLTFFNKKVEGAEVERETMRRTSASHLVNFLIESNKLSIFSRKKFRGTSGKNRLSHPSQT